MATQVSMDSLNWGNFNEKILTVNDEEQCKQLLEQERAGQNRVQMVLRLYGRYAKLRRARELKELTGKRKR